MGSTTERGDVRECGSWLEMTWGLKRATGGENLSNLRCIRSRREPRLGGKLCQKKGYKVKRAILLQGLGRDRSDGNDILRKPSQRGGLFPEAETV